MKLSIFTQLLLLPAIFLIIPACGNNDNNDDVLNGLVVDINTLEINETLDGYRPIAREFGFTIYNFTPGQVFLFTSIEGTALSSAFSSLAAGGGVPGSTKNSGTVSAQPINQQDLGIGIYIDTITISACLDIDCNTHYPGSPKTVDVIYRITAA